MKTDVIVPENLWEDDKEGVVTAWLISDKANVSQGDLVAEVMVEKAQYEINSPASGKIEIIKQEEEVINKGDVIATVSEQGETP